MNDLQTIAHAAVDKTETIYLINATCECPHWSQFTDFLAGFKVR